MSAIVPRSEWGARPAKSIHRIPTPTPRLWVHHAADDRQGAAAVRAHQAFHQGTRGWTDIAYSFLIGNDGTIYEGRGAGIAGGHTAGDNTRSHAICLLGNFDNRAPTKQALDSLVWLARHGTDRRWWVPTLGGHRDAPGASTACPGRHLYAALPGIRARLSAPTPAPPPAALPVHQEDDTMLIRHPDGRIYLCGPGGATHLTKMATVDALAKKGIPYVQLSVGVDADRIIGDADRPRRLEMMLTALAQIEAREEQRDLANDPATA